MTAKEILLLSIAKVPKNNVIVVRISVSGVPKYIITKNTLTNIFSLFSVSKDEKLGFTAIKTDFSSKNPLDLEKYIKLK